MQSVQKVLLRFFPAVCPLPHLFLPCDTKSHFGSMLYLFWTCSEFRVMSHGYATCHWHVLCPLKHSSHEKLWVQNMAGYHQICFRTYESGKGQTRGKNCKSTFVLTAFNFFGRLTTSAEASSLDWLNLNLYYYVLVPCPCIHTWSLIYWSVHEFCWIIASITLNVYTQFIGPDL